MISNPIADLHCDLLHYLTKSPERTAYDLRVPCGIPQLQEGGVKLQTMAIFCETYPDSSAFGVRQAQLFHQLPKNYPEVFYQPVNFSECYLHPKIAIAAAIENASAFMEESEDFEEGIKRFNRIRRLTGRLLYVSMTWNSENRFGGGVQSSVGLKEDGKRLLELFHKHRIPLDISHASDRLVEESLDYIDKHGLKVEVVASHSNMRAVENVPRNLPDEFVKEIILRNGIIGFNFFQPFVGMNKLENFVMHFEHLLKLGGLHHCAFGADFFCGEDFISSFTTQDKYFFREYRDASSYPQLLNLWKFAFNLSEEEIYRVAYQNLVDFAAKSI